jgi:hypothetical protein
MNAYRKKKSVNQPLSFLLHRTLCNELSAIVAINKNDSTVILEEKKNQKKYPHDDTKLKQFTIKKIPDNIQILNCDNMRFFDFLKKKSKIPIVHMICENRCDYVLLTETKIYFLDLKSLSQSNDEVKKQFLGTRSLIRVLHEINTDFTKHPIDLTRLTQHHKLYYIKFTTNQTKIKYSSSKYIYQPADNFYESKLTNYGIIQINNNEIIEFDKLKQSINSKSFNLNKQSKL